MSEDGSVAVVAKSLTKRFPSTELRAPPREIFFDFSLQVQSGRTLAVLGPSGCGKSTLLRMLAGLDRPDEGGVQVFGGAPLPQTKDGEISLLFSSSSLLPWRTAETNVRLPLDLLGWSRSASMPVAQSKLSAVSLGSSLWRSRPEQLSEGQKQRVRLAQALVTEPRLLLLDEPFSNVDEGLRRVLMELIRDYLEREDGRSSVLVTHNPYEAAILADEAIILAGEPAREVYRRPLEDPPSHRDSAYVHNIADDLTAQLVALTRTDRGRSVTC